MDAKLAKTLKINLGAVKRLSKEVKSYEDEYDKCASDLETTKFEQGTYGYKNLVALKDEAEAMIRDTKRRLSDFKKKLENTLSEAQQFESDPQVIEAKQLLESLNQ